MPVRTLPTAIPHLAAIAIAATLVAIALGGTTPESASAQASGCPAQPKGLSPTGGGPKRYTMLLRVNQLLNAQVYANPDEASGGLGPRIRSNDVFIVNTRFSKGDPAEWDAIVGTLAAAFPCNRIVALNGLGTIPGLPGYAYASATIRASPG
ncbi:hypothetical protein BH20ACT15_BH20ACT15_05590 [soil metagenome]